MYNLGLDDDGREVDIERIMAENEFLEHKIDNSTGFKTLDTLYSENDDNKDAEIWNEDNVYISETSYHGLWGHISLVWMQLNGFFELLDLADWDHVINLSASDYPLRSSMDIHKWLSLEKNKGMSFAEDWDDGTCLKNIFIPNM